MYMEMSQQISQEVSQGTTEVTNISRYHRVTKAVTDVIGCQGHRCHSRGMRSQGHKAVTDVTAV
jgi:hypothetical protein